MIVLFLFNIPYNNIELRNEDLLGLQKSLFRYFATKTGLPFVAPLAKGIVIAPAAVLGGLWLLQYGLTSNIYYDEYDGEAREESRPKLLWWHINLVIWTSYITLIYISFDMYEEREYFIVD